MDNMEHLFTSQDLVPDELLLRSHAETTRVDGVSLKIDHTGCQILDVGGLRLERDKWAQCIKGVDTPVFVVSLTGYCQPCDEDPELVSASTVHINGRAADSSCYRIKWKSL